MNIEILSFIVLMTILNILSFKKNNNYLFCGLVGFSGKTDADMMKIKFLLYWNSITRGKDATGVFSKSSGIIKDTFEAQFFINSNEFLNIKTSNTIIGHVRAKTVGLNTVANAHPFKYGNLIGAHNGSLKNHWSLCTKYNLEMKDYDVDSQVLISILNKNFEDNTPFKALSEYEGAAALLLYDETEDVLYACHDSERPLFYGYLKSGMYISSIEASLEAIGCIKIKEFPINKVHKIKNGLILETVDYLRKEIPKGVETKIALSSDIYVVDNVCKFVNPTNVRGVTYAASRADMFLGFWVRINSVINIVSNPAIKYNTWYHVVNIKKETSYSTDKLIVIDDHNKHSEISLVNIDCGNFIPVLNDFVKLTYDIESVDKKTKVTTSYGIKDDVCKVLKYSYKDETLKVINLDNNEIFHVYSNCVRNLTDSEKSNALSFYNESPFTSLTIVKKEEESTSSKKEVIEEDSVNEDDFEVIDEKDDIEETQDFLLRVIESIDELELHIKLNNVKESSKLVNELSSELKNFYLNMGNPITC